MGRARATRRQWEIWGVETAAPRGTEVSDRAAAGSNGPRDLRELWYEYARATSDARLVALAVAGLIGAVGFVVLLFVDATRVARWWPLVLPVAFAGAFGVWGIADREMVAAGNGAGGTNGGDYIGARRGWTVVRGAASVVAGGAGIAAMLEVLRVGLGTWIS
jgi:hypothetical protein